MYCAHTALTYRWPSSWCLAALWGFIQPVVDAARYACLYHSCFLFGQCQRSAKPGHHWQRGRAGRTSELGSFLSVLLSLIHTESFNNFLTSCTTFTFFFFFFFTLNVLPPLPGELNTLPFSHMLLMFRMLSVTTGRSTAPERGDRDSLFSL